jgi:hypothetical protein
MLCSSCSTCVDRSDGVLGLGLKPRDDEISERLSASCSMGTGGQRGGDRVPYILIRALGDTSKLDLPERLTCPTRARSHALRSGPPGPRCGREALDHLEVLGEERLVEIKTPLDPLVVAVTASFDRRAIGRVADTANPCCEEFTLARSRSLARRCGRMRAIDRRQRRLAPGEPCDDLDRRSDLLGPVNDSLRVDHDYVEPLPATSHVNACPPHPSSSR